MKQIGFTQDEVDKMLDALFYYRDEATLEGREDAGAGMNKESEEYKILSSAIDKLKEHEQVFGVVRL
jgi:hypothetical protein